MLPDRHRGVDSHLGFAAVGPVERDDGVRPLGNGRAQRHPDRRPFQQGRTPVGRRVQGVEHRQADRIGRRRGRHVGGTHGVTAGRRAGEGGQRDVGDDVFAEPAAEGVQNA